MTFERWWRENEVDFRDGRDAAAAAWEAGRRHVLAEMSVDLPPGQQRVREFLIDFWAKHGWLPTLQQVADALGVSKPTVHEQVVALERKGLIVRERNRMGIQLRCRDVVSGVDKDLQV